MLYELKGDSWTSSLSTEGVKDDLEKYRLTTVQENDKEFRKKLKAEDVKRVTREFNEYMSGGDALLKPTPTDIRDIMPPVVIDIMVCPRELGGSTPRGTISWPREERKLMGILIDELNIYILPGCRADRVYDELLSLYQRLCVCMSPGNNTWKNFFKNNVPDLEEKLKTYEREENKMSLEDTYRSIYQNVPVTYKKTLGGYNATVNWI